MGITRRGSHRWLPIALRRTLTGTLAAASALAALGSAALAQDSYQHGGHSHDHVPLHINSRWRECSFQIDPSLTQEAWHQFAGEAGVVTYFRPLMTAEPMGAGKFEVSLVQWKTGIDANDAAWNDTFVHPDAEHVLFEGSGLEFPGITARAGITDRTDVGVYVTKSPGANYGFYGAQLQQNLVQDAGKKWSASARVSFVSMYGPEDLDFSVYGLDLVVSRKYPLWAGRASVSPYAVVSTSLSRAHEKTSVVDLRDENVLGAMGTVGAVAQLSMASVAVEYAFATVPSLSLKVGLGRR
jgi:hypothetical protein